MSITRTERASRGAALGYAMLFFAVGQLVSPVFNAVLGGSFTTANRNGEPPLTPAGYTFSIWFVIEILSVAYAVFAVRRRKLADADLLDRLAVPLVVLFAGFSVWLVAAEVEPVWSTLVVIVIMFAALLRALQIALAERARIATWPRAGTVLLWWTLGLYAGWISVAMWLNLTTAFAGAGAPITGTVGIAAQVATLAGALGTAVVILRWTGGLLPYAIAVGWGLIGAIVGTLAAGQPVLIIAAAVGLVIIVATTALTRRRSGSGTLAERLA
jgi:MFS family permease